jgi:glucuronokinase
MIQSKHVWPVADMKGGKTSMIERRTYSRIGLMGNPSDGFYGKTISSCITNFHTTVTLAESQQLRIIPHKIFDSTEFSSLRELVLTSNRDGYYGGIRLIYATCKRFSEYCRENGIALDDRNCTISYDTNIPRQVGLGGSSAIIVSLLKALMEFYGLTDEDIPLESQPSLVLSVETDELGINAGLQDRVVQTYGGTVFMNFDREVMDSLGRGVYERLDSGLLPNLFLAYIDGSGKDSGKMHNEVHFKFDNGDWEVIEAMSTFAYYAVQAKQVLQEGDHEYFSELMNANFDLRRSIYGDDAIGKRNLQMIEIARSVDAPAKFPGSGGAVIGIYRDEKQYRKLRKAYLKHGFRFTKVSIQDIPDLPRKHLDPEAYRLSPI